MHSARFLTDAVVLVWPLGLRVPRGVRKTEEMALREEANRNEGGSV
jgi:hypothetical protein